MLRAEELIRIAATLLLGALYGACASQHDSNESPDEVVPVEVGRCPPDIEKPIPKPLCDDERESSRGKWTVANSNIWESEDEPHLVAIRVRGGLKLCPRPLLNGAAEDYTAEWNREAQRCVRAFLEHIDVQILSSAGQVNEIAAELSWSQIQDVAELPDVVFIRAL